MICAPPAPAARRSYERLDVLPFLVVYALWLAYCAKTVLSFQWDRVWLLQLGSVALASAHALAFLSTVWSVDWACLIAYKAHVPLEAATHVKVVPHAFVGSKELVPLEVHVVVRSGLLGLGARRAARQEVVLRGGGCCRWKEGGPALRHRPPVCMRGGCMYVLTPPPLPAPRTPAPAPPGRTAPRC